MAQHDALSRGRQDKSGQQSGRKQNPSDNARQKNHLFYDNHKATQDMCVVQSLLATCRNHDVNPRAYLNDVIPNKPYYEKASSLELASLLPHRWIMDHPEAKINKVREMAK